jgi:hypothetical protein
MPFFPLAIMLVMLDLTLKQQNNVGVLALVFYAAIMLYFYDPLALIDGYVDIAVSFFGLLTLSQVSSISTGSDCKWKRILLAGLFAAAAALTKQAGFFVLAVFLGWVLWLLITKGSKMGRTENLRIAGSILTVLLIVGTWYWAKEIQISKGADYSAVQLVTHDIYAGASLPQRLAHAAVLLTTARGEGGRFIFMLLSGIFGLGLFFRSPRRLIWLSLLYLLLWGIFFSYDTRNLTLIYPVTALIMAQGVTCAMNWWHRNSWGLSVKIAAGFLIIGVIGLALDNITNRSMVFKQLWPTGLALGWGWLAVALGAGLVWVIIKNPDLILRRRWLITGVAVLCIGLASRLYPPQQIIDSQLQKQQRVGIESLNVRVYEYQREHDIPGLILSDYIFLPFLPGLREKTVYRQWPQGIKTVLQQPDQIGALLISQPVLNEANIRRETSQRFILIFDHAGYAFMAARP